MSLPPAAFLPGAERLPVLEGTTTWLRPIVDADAEALFAMCRVPETVYFTSREPMTDVAEAHEYIAQMARGFAERSRFQWAIERRADGAFLGTVLLFDLDARHRHAEVGYMLAREHWGQGYVGDALPVVVRFAFETLGLHRLDALCDPRNAASLRALERVGFRREGYRREDCFKAGGWLDAVLLGLLASDWRAGGAAAPGPDETARGLLRHAVATLAYRAAKALRDAPPGFADFRAAPDSRSPVDILAHVGDLLDWALTQVRGEVAWRDSAPGAWADEQARFHAALAALDAELARGLPLGAPAERVFQGGVADALTHVGQLAMLRRLAGAPVRGENYARAHIRAGQVGADQPTPVAEFG